MQIIQETHPQSREGQLVLALDIGSHLDPGIRRKSLPNEDALFVRRGTLPATSPAPPATPFALLLVADGMGGQGSGQLASHLAATSLVAYLSGMLSAQPSAPETWLSLLSASLQHANQMVYERTQEHLTFMGTTMTAVLVVETTASVAHVGHSRLYLYREPGGLTQITHDHSVAAVLVAAGVIAPDELYTHPSRKLLYQCLGEKATVEVETATVPLAAGDSLLVCSNGLWEMVRDPQIAAILTTPRPTPTDTAQALIQAALAGGGEDNISAIVTRVSSLAV